MGAKFFFHDNRYYFSIQNECVIFWCLWWWLHLQITCRNLKRFIVDCVFVCVCETQFVIFTPMCDRIFQCLFDVELWPKRLDLMMSCVRMLLFSRYFVEKRMLCYADDTENLSKIA